MKRGCVAGLLLAACLVLTGCSGFSPAVSGVAIQKKGGVTEVARENFEQSYYSKEELEQEIDAEISSYNDSVGSKAVKKRSFRVRDGVAQIRMTYATVQDYANFNHVDFYVGDIPGAVQAGYAFDGKFAEVSGGSVKEGSLKWGSQIMTGKNYSTVAFREPLLVEVPGTIRYVSENVKVTEKNTAVTEDSQTAYILYE